MATAKIDAEEDDTGILHSCEICGQSNLAEDALRRHVESAHIRFENHINNQFPFCKSVQVAAGNLIDGLVDFEFEVPPFCTDAMPIRPYFHQPKQSGII